MSAEAKGQVKVSEAELAIMQALWQAEAGLTAQQLGERLAERKWKRTTIATLLGRLADKGAVSAEKQGRAWVYRARLAEEDFRAAAVDSLLERVYHGSVGALAASLVANRELTAADIEELRQIFKL